jgi:serine/threonine-protein kinase
MMNPHEQLERASQLVGQVLRDKWRLDALIGVGGMATVYAATHRNGKRVAIKLLHPEMSVNPGTKSRFLREGYVANKVGHAGVVSVLDDDTTEDGRAFLVMELLEGETLKARWLRARKRMPLDEVLGIAHALLDVLAAAHEKGIVHRDLKPDNLFITTDGAVKVLDFGIARLRESSDLADATRSSAMLGTPAFMAPEQARSRWEWVDARTDLWAVGATMFTTLTGQFVHQGETATEILVAAAVNRARPLKSVMPDVPESVAALIDRALAFEQASRWPDARSFQVMTAAAMRGAKAEASPPTSLFFSGGTQVLSAPAPALPPPSGNAAPASSPHSSQSAPRAASSPSHAISSSGVIPAPAPALGPPAVQPGPVQATLALAPPSASTLMTMGAGSPTLQDPQVGPPKPRRSALVLGGAIGLLVVGGLIALAVTRTPGGSTQPGASEASVPSGAHDARPAASAAPGESPAATAQVAPLPPSASAQAAAPPSATASATPPRVGGSRPPRTSTPPPTKTSKPGGFLDKY